MKKDGFKVGDKVVYPRHGVGEIKEIKKKTVAGIETQVLEIVIAESGMKLTVPVDHAYVNGLRKVLDKKGVNKVYEILRKRQGKIELQTWNRRFREYSQKINTGSVYEIAEVLRDLCVLSSDKELSFGEKKMLDTAQHLLVNEIAIAKARPAERVKTELKEFFANKNLFG
ncbi:MAG TPA: CarD family transcriptional regulator [Oligoflexia bacterium]|nr:CarD family transcriptional regulator [Oligoflexia bacterium]HMP26639.1 CarD family transcriptional regulator [Oligoflexia bacterium]